MTSSVALLGHGVNLTRTVRALRELESTSGQRHRTVAVLDAESRGSWMDRQADEIVSLPAGASMFDVEAVSEALRDRHIDVLAVSSGQNLPWLAYARLAEQRGWTFVGPSAATLERLLDPIELRRTAEKAGVATVPWSGGAVESADQARAHAERIGYPVLCRSSASAQSALGLARTAADLPRVYARAREAARRSSSAVILEKFLPGVRRLEVPVISSPRGERWALDVIDASLRRRDGSVMVEAPASGLDSGVRDRLRDLSVELAEAFVHEHVGTMVFLFDPRSRQVTFLGYEFCFGGEHAAAEALRGIDLAKVQLHMALGGEALQPPPEPRGTATVVHVKVHRDEPGPVVLEHYSPASGPGVRVDSAAATGDRLVSGASIAEVVTWGATRSEALSRMKRALAESSLLVQGGRSSVSVIRRALDEPDPWAGPVDTEWLLGRLRVSPFRARRHAAVAIIEAAIEAYELEHAADRQAFHAAAKRGRPEVRTAVPRSIELEHEGHVYVLRVAARDDLSYGIRVENEVITAAIQHRRERDHHLVVGPERYYVVTARNGFTHRIEVNGEPHRVIRDRSGLVRSSVPAVVAAVDVREGDVVRVGDRLAVLEAMKTEMSLVAPFAGRVRGVMARANLQVAPGEAIVWLEPETRPDHPKGHREARVDFEDLGASARDVDALGHLESLVRGYDVDPEELRSALRNYGRGAGAEGLLDREKSVVGAFVALLELSPTEPESEEAEDGGLRLSRRESFRSYLMDLRSEGEGLPSRFRDRLRAALRQYGVDDLRDDGRLREALCRIYMALSRRSEIEAAVIAILGRQATRGQATVGRDDVDYRKVLDRLVVLMQADASEVGALAGAVRYRAFDGPLLESIQQEGYAAVDAAVDELSQGASAEAMDRIVASPLSLSSRILDPHRDMDDVRRRIFLEALARRYYRVRELEELEVAVPEAEAGPVLTAKFTEAGGQRTLVAWLGGPTDVAQLGPAIHRAARSAAGPVALDLYLRQHEGDASNPDELKTHLDGLSLPSSVDRVVAVVGPQPGADVMRGTAPCLTFWRTEAGWREDRVLRELHPMVAERLEIGRLVDFDLERVEAPEDIHVFVGQAREEPADKRVFIYAEVRELGVVRDEDGRILALSQLERVVSESLACLRRIRLQQPPRERTEANRLELFVWPVLGVSRAELMDIARKLAPATLGLGLEQVRVNARLPNGYEGGQRKVLCLSNPSGLGMELDLEDPDAGPVPVQTSYQQKVTKLRRRGLMHPYELIRLLTPPANRATPDLPPGDFVEYDFDDSGRLVPVERGPGENVSNIIVGLIRTYGSKYPEGMTRVALLGDPSRAMGSLAEPECRRIMAALDLAEELNAPAEWYAVSAGAEISKDRGTENMDWISSVLRRIIHYTQAGHELNIVVCGINVGAQPYWNAEATMLMHTKGVLIMVPNVAMVLTGKQALDYSGGVSAEDNLGIGGYERIMGPNGQAQYVAPDLLSAGKLLLRHYDHAYRAPKERYPRPRASSDPRDRDVCHSPHGAIEGSSFETVGDVFSDVENPGRKRPFDIRKVMRALSDVDSEPLERWRDMRDAETVVTWDAHVGGYPVALLGIESRPIRRFGFVPADGPRMWTAGTLFPQSSKKAARAINAASGNRPLVILANLTGFDGSPESLRQVQLEYGAEIGRAIVNFDGPIVFTVISRYHGGAFVVFSNRLNERMETFALEGTYASVIGGAPAAAVVFARELKNRVEGDSRVKELVDALREAQGAEKAWLTVRLQETKEAVHSEHLGRLAAEYDGIHNIERACSVRSVHRILPASSLRHEVIAAVERGMEQDVPSS